MGDRYLSSYLPQPHFCRPLIRSVSASRAPVPVEIEQSNGDVDGEACFTSKRRAWMHVSSPHRGHSFVVFSEC
jgi:hypothetical protein